MTLNNLMLELLGMQSTPSLPMLPGPLWPRARVVAPDKGPIYGLNRTKYWFLKFTVFCILNCTFMLNWFVWNRTMYCPVGYGCRIHRLPFWRGLWPPPNKCPGYDTKQFDSEVPVMLGLWGMWSTPSLPLLPGPLWLRVVAPDMARSMG